MTPMDAAENGDGNDNDNADVAGDEAGGERNRWEGDLHRTWDSLREV